MTEHAGAGLLRKMIMKWRSSIFNGGAGKTKKGSRRTRPPLVGRERKRERKEEMHFSQIHGSITKHITMKFKFKHRVIFSTMLLYMIVPNYNLSLLMLEEIPDISGRSWVFR